MEVTVRIGIGLLLLGHGLVHLLWFAPDDDPDWPFRTDRSWLVPGSMRTAVAAVLVGLVVSGFALLALAVWGVPGLVSVWPSLATGAAIASLAVLVLYVDRRLLWGAAIDVAVIVVALWRPGWTGLDG